MRLWDSERELQMVMSEDRRERGWAIIYSGGMLCPYILGTYFLHIQTTIFLFTYTTCLPIQEEHCKLNLVFHVSTRLPTTNEDK